jgi:hypothetical protein
VKQSTRLYTLVVSLLVLILAAPATFAQCTTPFASQPTPPSTDDVWIDDSLPAGATVSTGTVNWDTWQYATGAQSFYHNGAGQNTVRIDNLNEFIKFGTGKLVLYALIDPCATTQQIRITYSSGARTVSLYWGTKVMTNITTATFSRGALPAAGTWARLEIPVGSPATLQGHTVSSLIVETYDGRVWFDHIGTDDVGCTPSVASAPSLVSGTVWVDDGVPSGAYVSAGDWWTSQKASGTQSLAYPYFGQTAISVVRVTAMNEPTNSGDNLFLYVMPTGCSTLKELKITWYSDPWTKGSIYYGTVGVPSIGGESSSVFMGTTLPPNDTWTLIEIPASLVGMDGANIYSVMVESQGGQTWVDYIGTKAP